MIQYYYIEIRTVPYWHDDIKLKVESFKQLKDYVKNHIESNMRYYPLTHDIKKDNGIKKVFKRLKTTNMYITNKNGEDHKSGKVFFIEYMPTEDKMNELKDYGYQSYVSYWCRKMTKEDLMRLATYEYKGIDE